MDIRIGVQHTGREITLDSEESPETIEAAVTDAIRTGGLLRLVDAKGGVVCVRGEAIGYVEIGAPRKGGVGFGML